MADHGAACSLRACRAWQAAHVVVWLSSKSKKKKSKRVSVGTAKLLLIHYSLSSVFIAHHSIAPPLTDVEFILTIGIRVVGCDRGNNADHSSAPPSHLRLSRSPVPCRRGSSGHGVIVERVIEKSVMGITYPVLTRTNYSEWSLVMRVNLQAAGLASRMAPLIIMKIGMR
jgi:hypothetical protein